jgi:hypothetical protein
LEHAKRVWERPIGEQLRTLAAQMDASQSVSESLLIWNEQLQAARDVVERELGLTLQTEDARGHYCRVSIAR